MSRKYKEPIPQHLRDQVFKRDKYTCQYCGKENLKSPHADHVYPQSKGGETSIDNLVTACKRCNSKKYDKVGIWPKTILTKDVIHEVHHHTEPIFAELAFPITIVVYALYSITGWEFLLTTSVILFFISLALIFIRVEVRDDWVSW